MTEENKLLTFHEKLSFWARLRRSMPFQKYAGRICVILNPASGQTNPVLKTFNQVFHQVGYDWEIRITNKFGDGQRHARQAVAEGANIVAVYGGDGSIMDVAAGMIDTHVPLAILPGGTGNALATQFALPRLLRDACLLAVHPEHIVRSVDVGEANGRIFMLRAGIGLEAMIVKGAERPSIDRFGVLSYVVAGLEALNQCKPSHYSLDLDGEKIEIDGLACMVANAASLGLPGLILSPNVSISDGLLDVFVIRKADLLAVVKLADTVLRQTDNTNDFPHWQARRVRVVADPPQDLEGDGEWIGPTPAEISLRPGALRLITGLAESAALQK